MEEIANPLSVYSPTVPLALPEYGGIAESVVIPNGSTYVTIEV